MRAVIVGVVVAAGCGRVNFGYPLVACEEVVAGTSTLWSENDHCYSRHDVGTTASGAAAACASIGGHVATITSPGENEAMRAGLGLAREVRIGMGTGSVADPIWAWTTGEPAPYANWPGGSPVLCPTQGGNATLTPDGSWGTVCADTGANFACEIEPWLVRDDGHAYRVHWDNTNWFTASAGCESFGAHLAVITSMEEHAFVASLIYRDVWIGGSKTTGGFEWITGEAVEGFTPWSFNEPDAAGPACLRLVGSGLSWDDDACASAAFALCEREP